MITFDFDAPPALLTPELEKYAIRKLAWVERAMPRSEREVVRVGVRFRQRMVAGEKQNSCKLTLTSPKHSFTAQETTVHLYSALDIVAAALRADLKRYKASYSRLHVRRSRSNSE